MPYLKEGRSAARTGLGIHPNHFALLGLEASMLNLEGRWRASQGEDPAPLFRRALARMEEASRANPRDPDLVKLKKELGGATEARATQKPGR